MFKHVFALPVCHLLLENFYVIYFSQEINGFPFKTSFLPKNHIFHVKIQFSP